MMDTLIHLFPGIGSFFIDDPVVAFSRIALIIFGMVLAYCQQTPVQQKSF